MRKVNNLNDLMLAAADALEAKDVDQLEQLIKISDDWLQSEEAHYAQMVLLDAMIEACM